MDPWEIAKEALKQAPVAAVLGFAAWQFWKKLQQKDAEINALREQQRQDLKESSKQLLESARLMDGIIRKAHPGRSLSPFPSSTP